MASLNKVMLIGNLTRDPEVKYTPKGTAIVEIGLAMNRNYTTADGEKREEVTFVDVSFFGKQAEVLGQWMKKGRPLYVEGRLKLDSWDDRESGKKQYKLRVTGEEFQFLGSKNESGGSGQYDEDSGSRSSGGGYSQNRPAQSQQRSPQHNDYDDSPPPRNAPPQQQRPDAFPPGMDDDEIPF
jgi:single-strand DNA-binding protein